MMKLQKFGLASSVMLALFGSALARAQTAPNQPNPPTQVQYVQCESNGNNSTQCAINGNVQFVRVDHQLSWTPCEEGKSWGWYQNVIWVQFGCRAVFEVQIQPYNQTAYEDIHCRSSGHHYAECYTHLQSIYDMQVLQQQSNASCNPNQSYGWNANRVWVDRGCEATFRVYGYY